MLSLDLDGVRRQENPLPARNSRFRVSCLSFPESIRGPVGSRKRESIPCEDRALMRIVPALATPQSPNVAAPRYSFSGLHYVRQAFVSLSDVRTA